MHSYTVALLLLLLLVAAFPVERTFADDLASEHDHDVDERALSFHLHHHKKPDSVVAPATNAATGKLADNQEAAKGAGKQEQHHHSLSNLFHSKHDDSNKPSSRDILDDVDDSDVPDFNAPNKKQDKNLFSFLPKIDLLAPFKMMGNMFNEAVRPIREFVDLMRRYHNWFKNYDEFVAKVHDAEKVKIKRKVAKQTFRAEYAKTDSEIIDAKCQRSGWIVKKSKEPCDHSMFESVDHIFEVLHALVPKLEARLERMKERYQNSMTRALDRIAELDGIIAALMSPMMEKAKKRIIAIVMQKAKEVAKDQVTNMARVATLNAIAGTLNGGGGLFEGPLKMISYLIGLVTGKKDATEAGMNDAEVQARVAGSLLDKVNPVSNMMNFFSPKDKKAALPQADGNMAVADETERVTMNDVIEREVRLAEAMQNIS